MDSSWQMEQPDKMSQDTKSQKEIMKNLAAQGHTLASDILAHASVTPTRSSFTIGLAGTISTTATMLSAFLSFEIALPHEVEQHTIRAVCIGVKAIFEHVGSVLAEVKNGGAIFTMSNFARLDDTLIAKLGGMAEADPLNWRLEGLRGHLVCIFDAVKYLGLKKAEKESSLDGDQEKELKRLAERLPFVMEELQARKNGLLQTVDEILSGEDWGNMKVSASRYNPTYRAQARDDDAMSAFSETSYGPNDFIAEDELYEYWLLQRLEGENRGRRGWRFLGLKVTEHFEETIFSAEGRPKPQKELKARDEEVTTDEEKAKREAKIKKAIAAMPHRLQTELECIIRDRDRSCSNPRYVRDWSVIDIKPLKPKITTPAMSWGAWWKGEGGNAEWECIIKGITITTAEKDESMKMPNRFADPFRRLNRREVLGRPQVEVYPRERVVETIEYPRRVPYDAPVIRRNQGFVLPEVSAEDMEENVAGALAAVTVSTERAEKAERAEAK